MITLHDIARNPERQKQLNTIIQKYRWQKVDHQTIFGLRVELNKFYLSVLDSREISPVETIWYWLIFYDSKLDKLNITLQTPMWPLGDDDSVRFYGQCLVDDKAFDLYVENDSSDKILEQFYLIKFGPENSAFKRVPVFGSREPNILLSLREDEALAIDHLKWRHSGKIIMR